MELFVHQWGSETPLLIETSETVTVREFLRQNGDPDHEGMWAEDAEVELELDVTLEDAGLAHRHHVHHHRCRRVKVKVRFGGRDLARDFSPATRVARVFEWAVGPDGFNLPQDQRPEHELVKCDGDHPIAPSVHVGSLTEGESCDACLDLAAKHNPQG